MSRFTTHWRGGVAVAVAAAAAAVGCCAPGTQSTGWAEDPGCAHVRDAVAHGEAVDYVTYPQRGWMLHQRRYFTASPMEDSCWRSSVEGGR